MYTKAKDPKKILISKMPAIKEHERLVPELKKAGLKKEAKLQAKDLKEIKNK